MRGCRPTSSSLKTATVSTGSLGPLKSRPIHVLDVGAHAGAFACHLADRNPQSSFDCVEPSGETADYLERNVSANGLVIVYRRIARP